jgi:hypothetical protein
MAAAMSVALGEEPMFGFCTSMASIAEPSM